MSNGDKEMQLIPTTRFDKKLFEINSGYIYYPYNGKKNAFVARFKYSKSPFTKAKFLKELIANHTVEDYFMALEQRKAPLEILRDKNEDWYYGILEAFGGRDLRKVA
jgi:hypothetical protein